MYTHNVRKFIKSGYEKLKNLTLNAQGSKRIIEVLHGENICNNSGGAQEKGKNGVKSSWTQFTTKIDGFKFHHPISPPPLLNGNVLLFCRFLFNLRSFATKLKVLVLCFLYFRDNSNLWLEIHKCEKDKTISWELWIHRFSRWPTFKWLTFVRIVA